MFEPVRGGTRGGQAEFKWSDVSADKDRENYLGHSINAPTGRWQKNKDIHWYNRDLNATETERQDEIRKVKELEAEALAKALYDISLHLIVLNYYGTAALTRPPKQRERLRPRQINQRRSWTRRA
ncbi:kinase phosphorylation protein-domain-containing protein [Infundibulicybe gibba]|nr:kinase phosphorylation protein-domain-containing protein [Infundibulicybe gibba]